QQDGETDAIRTRRTADLLRRDARAQCETVHTLGEQQQLEDRQAELIGIVGGRGEQDLPSVARRAHQSRDIAQQTLREIGETQLLEILHFAAHDALVHRFVERDEGLLQETAQALADEKLRQVILQLAHS